MAQDERHPDPAELAEALEKLWKQRKLGGPCVASNGNGAKSWAAQLGPQFWTTLVLIIIAASGTWFVTKQQVACNAEQITVARAEMKADYMRKDVGELRLTVIEKKIDEQGADIKDIRRALGIGTGKRSDRDSD